MDSADSGMAGMFMRNTIEGIPSSSGFRACSIVNSVVCRLGASLRRAPGRRRSRSFAVVESLVPRSTAGLTHR